jgi:hypothetical protein
MAVITPKRLYAGTPLTGAGSTLYTAPALTKAIVKNIVISNVTNADQTITMNISGFTFLYNLQVGANSTAMFDLSLVLETGESITAISSTTNALTVFISGVEVK